jgi:hypothetical protein
MLGLPWLMTVQQGLLHAHEGLITEHSVLTSNQQSPPSAHQGAVIDHLAAIGQ